MTRAEIKIPTPDLQWNPFHVEGIKGKDIQPLLHETSQLGLRIPFKPLDIVPLDQSKYIQDWAQAKRIFSEKALNADTLTVAEAFDYLYCLQAGTLQSLLAQAVLKGALSFAQTKKASGVYDRGGGTRRLETPAECRSDGYISIEDEFFSVFFRLFREQLLKKPNGISALDHYEKSAETVLDQIACNGHNLDWKTECDRSDLPEAADHMVSSIIHFLDAENIQYTIHCSPGKPTAEIHIDDYTRFWHPYAVPGFVRQTNFDTDSKKHAFYFGPKIEPDKFIIQVGLFHPKTNPTWTIAQVGFGVAKGDSEKGFTFLDLKRIFLSPIPTEENGLKPFDNRYGNVTSIQHEMYTKYSPDGTITLPTVEEYQAHQPTMSTDLIDNLHDPGNTLIRMSRTFRYGNFQSTAHINNKTNRGYPVKMPDTYDTFEHLIEHLYRQLESGQKIPEHKKIEFWMDMLLAIHNSDNHVGAAIRVLDSPHKRTGFPNIDSLLISDYGTPRYGNPSSTASALVYVADENKIICSSGIISLLIAQAESAYSYLKNDRAYKRLNPQYAPTGSLLEQILWTLDPSPEYITGVQPDPQNYYELTKQYPSINFELHGVNFPGKNIAKKTIIV